MKQTIKTLLVLSATCLTVGVLTGCKKGDKINSDPKTINLRLYKAGYGSDFIYELQEKFEEVYEEEGYKVNVLTPSYDTAGDVVLTELAQGYKNTQIDLYITGAVNPNMVSAEGQYGCVVEDIRDLVYEQPCINYDGTEGKKVSELINHDNEEFLCSDDGHMYGFAWAQSSAGLVVNSKKLAKYGITELPRTTKEFLAACEAIYFGANGVQGSHVTRTYPITYTIGRTGYSDCAFDTWHAQLGIQKYKEFFRMQNYVEGNWVDMENGIGVFDDPDLVDVLYEAYRFMDINLAANGSTTQSLDQAQAKIMKEGNDTAVFMFNGDWFLNEIKLNYKNQLDDVEFINVPVISKVGTNVFGSGTKYNLSEDACDEMLSYVCKLVDENLTNEQIKAKVLEEKSIEMDDADVQTICDARGVTYARGPEHLAFITKGSEKKDIAAKFLRMMASADYAETFMKTSNCSTPYADEIKTASKYKFVNEAKNIVLNKHYRAVRGLVRGQRRKVPGLTLNWPGCAYVSQEIANDTVSKYDGNGGVISGKTDSIYRDAAVRRLATVKTTAQKAWTDYFKK